MRPGSRLSSYQIPQYKKLAAVYGPLTLQSINATDSAHPTVKPVPYTGIEFLDIPEFQDLGTNVSEQFSAAIAGQQSAAAALYQAQLYAQAVGDTTGAPDAPREARRRTRTEATMTVIAPPVAVGQRARARPAGPPGLGTPRAAAARARLHDHHHPAAVPADPVVLAAVVEPGPRDPGTSQA